MPRIPALPSRSAYQMPVSDGVDTPPETSATRTKRSASMSEQFSDLNTMRPVASASPESATAPKRARLDLDGSASLSSTRQVAKRQEYPLNVTVAASAAAVRAVFAEFKADKEASGKPVAVVLGGSISGYATALALAKNNFNVLVVEKRQGYGRQNVFSLKQDAIFSLARLAPDRQAAPGAAPSGGLLRTMLENKLLTTDRNKIERTGKGLERMPQKQHRFMNWLVPTDGLPSRIPQMKRKTEGISAYLDVDEARADADTGWASTPASGRADYLDPAWPDKQAVSAANPDDWRLGDVKGMSADNLVFSQVMDLEKGLHDYCAGQPGIRIVRGEVELRDNGAGTDTFVPLVLIGGESVQPDFPVDLICVAEGARSPNREVIGGKPAQIDPNESWRQGNYVQTGHAAPQPSGFEMVDAGHDPLALTVTQYIEQANQSLVNISVYAPADSKSGEKATRAKLEQAQEHLVAGGATSLQVDEDTRQFDSGEIDVKLLRAKVAVKGNVVLVGDAVASGSPAGGYGASLSLSAYPEAVERLVTNPLFRGSNGAVPKQLQEAYRKDVANIAEVRHGRPNDIMRGIGAYSAETGEQVGQQIAKARFQRLG